VARCLFITPRIKRGEEGRGINVAGVNRMTSGPVQCSESQGCDGFKAIDRMKGYIEGHQYLIENAEADGARRVDVRVEECSRELALEGGEKAAWKQQKLRRRMATQTRPAMEYSVISAIPFGMKCCQRRRQTSPQDCSKDNGLPLGALLGSRQ